LTRKRSLKRLRRGHSPGSLRKQLQSISKEAHQHGLRIRPCKKLSKTPYRGMNPRAAKLLKQPCPPKSVTYDPQIVDTLHEKVVDLRHEVIEHKEIGRLQRKGVPAHRRYPMAHKRANRYQTTIGGEHL